MDSTRPTPVISFDPHAAWHAAALRNKLSRLEALRTREALRVAAMLGPEDDRPTIPAPAPC